MPPVGGTLTIELIGGATRPTHKRYQPHDHIELSIKTHDRIYEKCAPLYEKGMSLREIARQTGIPKTTIRETLNAKGMVLRNYVRGLNTSPSRTREQKPGRPPYGYGYLNGKLMKDPREYSVVQQILLIWSSGKSFQAITTQLNNQGTVSRNRKKWTRCVVRSIILRHKLKTEKPGEE